MCSVISETLFASKGWSKQILRLPICAHALPCHPIVDVLKPTCENPSVRFDVLTAVNNIWTCALLSMKPRSQAKGVPNKY